ncbi:MAG: CBS domain-containing protein [Anaerolineae bacterium]|nr:CBS domain-containing protein [Anaerolineae bacterium]MBL6965833.1 CBS domain-containing protein [Anaerolineales bacterium]
MLVGERMSHPVITIAPDLPITEAVNLMRKEHIRRTPVVKGGKLVGIVSDKDLLNASPSPATSLSIWEMNYLLSKIKVEDVMTTEILSINVDTPVEEAARIMADNKIGGLPVMKDNRVVGMITETDLFKIFLELMGAREKGIRVTAMIPEKVGELADLTKAIAEAGGNFISFGQTAGEDPSNREVTFKVSGLDESKVKKAIDPFIEKITDIRLCCP